MSTKIGIRHETKNRWERRAPLVPADVERLTTEGHRFVVQSSDVRTYGDDLYRAAGAEIADDLSSADVVFGVKEVPIEELRAGVTYAFFSHVIKGQAYNMGLLRRLLELGVTLIDYERIANDAGRLVLFGREAGLAGMIDTLHLLGRRLAWEGYRTSLAEIRPAHTYTDLDEAKAAVAAAGEGVRRGLDLDQPPLVVGFLGDGHVSRGAQEIFDLLPFDEVAPENLAATVTDGRRIRDRLLKVVFGKEHSVRPVGTDRTFDAAEYRQHPERYTSAMQDYLPHTTALVNAIYWTDDLPRLVTKQSCAELWRAGQRRLRIIADLSCDVEGGVELTHKVTEPDHPTFVYDPIQDSHSDGFRGRGIVILAVDNLPCELPREASAQFSRALSAFVPAIAAADYSRPFEDLELPTEVHRAVVTHRGELTPDYRYLESYLAEAAAATAAAE